MKKGDAQVLHRRNHGVRTVNRADQRSEPFAEARAVLEASATGEWVLIHESEEVGRFDSFDDAAANAVEQFGVGSYLIRTGGAVTVTLPASVVFGGAD